MAKLVMDTSLNGIRFLGIAKGKRKIFNRIKIFKITEDLAIGDAYMCAEPLKVLYKYKGEWQTAYAEPGDFIICTLDDHMYSPKLTYHIISNTRDMNTCREDGTIWLRTD